MQLTVFGATGGTGLQVVTQALRAGHQVRAVVRDPAGLTIDAHPRLIVHRADVTDPAAIAPALAGTDAAISAIGSRTNRQPTAVCADTAASITQAMRDSSIQRLVIVSASGIFTDGDDPFTRALAKPVLKRILRHPFADMLQMEQIVRETDLHWTIMRPPMLTNGPATGAYRTEVGRNVFGGIRLSRADLAHCILRGLDEPAWTRATVAVAR
ncbi:SDR family oxidoreductase [Micromonospora polyrhachis]|uniref:Putative NADH-flavin reductase n=1 Tax=Micromonospora polyrhachis TaxID=1282883 RepID=A0A7W7WNT6_9ACTN|nr:NAD(P)H-binding protein [Micromonospora polyrhachis]MBB4957513.1 putative NADH-flavin reductase [Micromonospora polyrhachis]